MVRNAMCGVAMLTAQLLIPTSEAVAGQKQGEVRIDGNVTINAETKEIEATTSGDKAGNRSENCIGVISGDVKVSGDVVVNRRGPAGNCDCPEGSIGCSPTD